MDRIKAFATFGVTLDDIRKKQPQQIFLQMMRAMETGGVTNERYAAGIRLLGAGFEDLIPAAKKGFVAIAEQAGRSNNKFLDGTTLVLEKAAVAWEKYFAGIKKKLSGFKTGLVGGAVSLSDLIGAAGYNLLAPFSKKAAARRDELLQERAQMMEGGDGSRDVEANEKKLADAENAKKTREEVDKIKKELKSIGGDDAEDIINDLDDRGARIEEWRRALSRAKRQQARTSNGESQNRTAPSVDALQRIGLFVGDPTGVRREIQKQTMQLTDIKRELERVNNSLNKE
jgi:hypothetical protein